MCAVSVIYDMFDKMPDVWYNKERIDLFRRMLQDAEKFDVEASQPDCFDPEKAKLLVRISELENIIKNK